MHSTEEIRHLLSNWGELRAQDASLWKGDENTLPKEIADFYAQIGPWGEVIYESVGPVGITLSVGGNPVCIPPLGRLFGLQAGYAWQSDPDKPFDNWPGHWLVIAEQGGDPFIYDRLSWCRALGPQGFRTGPLHRHRGTGHGRQCASSIGRAGAESRRWPEHRGQSPDTCRTLPFHRQRRAGCSHACGLGILRMKPTPLHL